ncbi:heavy-metal-associated domain-containing protein [Clostridium intestinale]|jgi:copper ion binding protein|uniref:Heavy-metal-binding protein n=1 Tax=Clostridium intestinale URNW TaxID=1294142 RepID=U2NRJ9_9CLOT|nr:copper ion binding protein [Clostridium intestinale]ERK31496.1 heavy-metal-binding protein [Clostridium intestinale URNW]
MKKKILVEGMSCGHCVNHVKEALMELEGVSSVNVTLDDKTAILEASKDINDEDIKFVIDDAGYEVAGIEEL